MVSSSPAPLTEAGDGMSCAAHQGIRGQHQRGHGSSFLRLISKVHSFVLFSFLFPSAMATGSFYFSVKSFCRYARMQEFSRGPARPLVRLPCSGIHSLLYLDSRVQWGLCRKEILPSYGHFSFFSSQTSGARLSRGGSQS